MWLICNFVQRPRSLSFRLKVVACRGPAVYVPFSSVAEHWAEALHINYRLSPIVRRGIIRNTSAVLLPRRVEVLAFFKLADVESYPNQAAQIRGRVLQDPLHVHMHAACCMVLHHPGPQSRFGCHWFLTMPSGAHGTTLGFPHSTSKFPLRHHGALRSPPGIVLLIQERPAFPS